MPDGNSFRQLISPNAQSGNTDYNKSQDVEKVLATRAERLRAQKAAGNLAPRAEMVNAQFTGASYGWMWPFRAGLERWYDAILATLPAS